jgi:alpha-glucosidase
MPWEAGAPHLGFGGPPWLPMPESHRPLAVSAQDSDPDSTLAYARRLVAARKAHPALARGSQKLIAGPGVGFLREADGARILCLFNPSPREIAFELAGELPGDLAGARALDFGTGEARADGSTVILGPYAAWFGELTRVF